MRVLITAMLLSVLLTPMTLVGQSWRKLYDGKTLEGWEVLGDGVWNVLPDGTLVGQRKVSKAGPFDDNNTPVTRKQYEAWRDVQSWLYTNRDFGEFDLELEYWVPVHANSGISLRDASRAQYAITMPVDFSRTPSKIGYEIQINNEYPDPTPSGSLYTFTKAPEGLQNRIGWNKLRIESRDSGIKVFLNGKPASEHPGDPKRSKTGPIGLQLHDRFSLVMFRDIRIRELKSQAR